MEIIQAFSCEKKEMSLTKLTCLPVRRDAGDLADGLAKGTAGQAATCRPAGGHNFNPPGRGVAGDAARKALVHPRGSCCEPPPGGLRASQAGQSGYRSREAVGSASPRKARS